MIENIKQVESFFNNRYKFGIKPGLERMMFLLKNVGNPQQKINGVHIAGTNGKGSTIQFLRHALMKNELRVGVFSSPSLNGVLGHIQTNDGEIAEEVFLNLFNQLLPHIEELDRQENHPTEFEIITVIAFMYFKDCVDIALIEAGMGGKEDTTNCFTPICSVITTVDRDHTAFLGDSITEIASHKAGIIKPKVPVVIGDLSKEALTVVHQEADKNQAPLFEFHKDFSVESIETTSDSQSFEWFHQDQKIDIKIMLNGVYQIKNASLAMMVLFALKDKGLSLTIEKCLEGFKETRIPGRYEEISTNPRVIIDGAHNIAGIQAFIDTVQENDEEKTKHLIFSGFKDKELMEMLKLCLPHFDSITVTTFDHPRAIKLEDLQIDGENKIKINSDWKQVVREIVNKNNNELHFFTGSLNFIGKIRKYFVKK
ncbi:bifunctional folylpolyglutamate synthase/dihydrofolate synthase [Ornithinibacillus halophilus]|uniref:tetrahydrofolate synthase n=1 Tax=Ornithinibacillus halophilus TaxID=930117 RepID=A0A1M5DDS3_9BACI|nr:folylpolyglutamate synthase/dihydrofolate synthase family protein [Ornithinibacillus halophilus]SHF65137.1 dihydrofolate synthase / folylpolyglutamate synthase [Ornithinibacillus halophilus]